MSNPCDFGMCNPSACSDKDCNDAPTVRKFYKVARSWRHVIVYRVMSGDRVAGERKLSPPKGMTAREREDWCGVELRKAGIECG
jgi:hypothetical protein